MEKTIFELIIERVIPATIVYEDEHTLAFLDAHPINPGHTLVVPKKHFKNLYEIDKQILHAIAETVQKVAIAVKAATNADGINVHQNNDAPAGQVIFHTHTHIIPRFIDDGYVHWRNSTEYDKKMIAELAEKIKSNL
jgi:histidine triad (HIT) family protein